MNESYLFTFLVQVFILLGIARFAGEIFNRWGLPALSAEILVGVFLGPSIFGRFLPQQYTMLFPQDTVSMSMFETMAWLGAFFLLLETGLEIDFSSAWRQRGDAMRIAIAGLLIPFIGGFILSMLLPPSYYLSDGKQFTFALFMAVILTISAMPITARALHDLHLSKTDVGFLIMSALSVNDIFGWVLFTVVFGFCIHTNASNISTLLTFILAISFVIFCLTIGRQLSNVAVNIMKSFKFPEPASSLTFIFLLGVLCAICAKLVGLHVLFGFFLAGIMAGGAKALSEKTRQTISQVVYAIFIPIFFIHIGLKMDFFEHFDLGMVMFVFLAGLSLRFLGAWIGTLFTTIPRVNRLVVAVAHSPGGMMEIVMGILALEVGLITPTVFIAIVFGALLTAMAMGPWLSWVVASRPKISVFEFFNRRGIVLPLKVKTRDEAIYQLAKVAAEEAGLHDEEIVVNAVLKRENLMGTAIEEGIALPHGRLADIRKPIVIFGRSLSGIDWNSPDGKPAQFIFLILTPIDDQGMHVQILRAIAQVMQQAENVNNILQAKDSAHVWESFQSAFAKLYVKSIK